MATNAELLTLARTELKNRLSAGAFESYSTGIRQFRGATILQLNKLIQELEQGANTNPAVLINDVVT